ncbi:LOW QUALITY PROTEIN: hypothetical protein N5P37_008887 [Trichoderma harzianum]|nr:LOW QUALITY PROTEIN: hypothetical protein N5P37_008887 [Trichoderma harzianum]
MHSCRQHIRDPLASRNGNLNDPSRLLQAPAHRLQSHLPPALHQRPVRLPRTHKPSIRYCTSPTTPLMLYTHLPLLLSPLTTVSPLHPTSKLANLRSFALFLGEPAVRRNDLLEKKRKREERKKQVQSAKKRIMNQKIQQPCLKSEQSIVPLFALELLALTPTASTGIIRLGPKGFTPTFWEKLPSSSLHLPSPPLLVAMGRWPVTVCTCSPQLTTYYYEWPIRRLDILLHLSSCRLLQTYMQLSLYPRPNACRKSTAARVRAAVLIRDQLRDRGKGPSLTARQLKRLWICSYEALRHVAAEKFIYLFLVRCEEPAGDAIILVGKEARVL